MKTTESLTEKINSLIQYEKTLPKDDRWDHFCDHVAPLMEEREFLHSVENQRRS